MKLKTYKLEKVEVDSTELHIPEETVYLFQTGKRRSIRIVPIFFDAAVYELKITCVYLSYKIKIEGFKIQVSMIERYYNSQDQSIEKEIIQLLLSGDCYERTEEQFTTDLREAFLQI